MKVLFATTNPAKIKKYKDELEQKDIELITVKDLEFKLNIDENGKDAIENAYKKAKAYYDMTRIPTIGMDNNLFIKELPAKLQPGTHVRRVKGRELTDEEMIKHYTELTKEYGGRLTIKWVYGMVICSNKGVKKISWSKQDFYFVDKPAKKINPGYPLDSISIIPEFNKYLVDLSEEEKIEYRKKDNINEVLEFIINNI